MGTALIGLVDDIALISHPKIKKFCQKQQNQDYQVIHFIHYCLSNKTKTEYK